MRRVGILCACVVLLWGPAAGAEERAAPLDWTYRDATHKFSLKMFRGFKQVPLKAGETVVVCKFRDPLRRGSARGTLNPEVQVVRYSTKAKIGPANIWDATVNNLWLGDAGKDAIAKAKAGFEHITSRDEPAIQGRLWQLEVPTAFGGDAHVTLAEFAKDGTAYGLYMRCGEPLARTFRSRFRTIARSFRYFDARAKDVARVDALEGLNLTARERVKIERSMVRGWDLIVSPKKNYVVVYNTKQGRNHFLARVVAKRIESIREQLFEKHYPSAAPIKEVGIVRVCADMQEYHAYGGPGGTAGTWMAADKELILYDASKSKKPDDDTLSALYVVAFQQYIHHALGGNAPHVWFGHGLADYYGGAKRRGDEKFVVKPFVWRVGTIRNAIALGPRTRVDAEDHQGKVRTTWEGSGYTPLREFVRLSRSEHFSHSTVSFAQGWALVYFLREVVPKNEVYSAKWGRILDTYFATLKAGKKRERALEAAFEGVDWAALEAAWLKAMGSRR